MNDLQTVWAIRGVQTIKSIQQLLNVTKPQAINIVYRLRKKGYVKTAYESDKTRVYHLAPEHAIGGTSYIDILNSYAPIKLMVPPDAIKIHGRVPSAEETLLYAINRRKVRPVIACLILFRKIRSWSLLYHLAKQQNLVREVAALYDVARLVVPKVRRMPQRFKNLAQPKKNERYRFIIEGFRSRDFQSIEKKWRVYIPLNQADLDPYRGVFT